VPKSSGRTKIRRPFVSREDLKILSREMGQQNAISPAERGMIHRVFELSSRTVGQVMVPQSQMTVAKDTATVAEFLQLVRDSRFRRLPVYSETQKRFIGIVNVADILAEDPGQRAGGKVTDYMRVPQFIPDYMPVDEILPRMRRHHQPVFLVTNVHSDVTGLVTMEDVLEEIVGNL
jgi:putative hemolysin